MFFIQIPLCLNPLSHILYTTLSKCSNKKLKINCNIHGEFEQLANAHYNGSGCPKCGKIKNIKNNTKNKNRQKISVVIYHHH